MSEEGALRRSGLGWGVKCKVKSFPSSGPTPVSFGQCLHNRPFPTSFYKLSFFSYSYYKLPQRFTYKRPVKEWISDSTKNHKAKVFPSNSFHCVILKNYLSLSLFIFSHLYNWMVYFFFPNLWKCLWVNISLERSWHSVYATQQYTILGSILAIVEISTIIDSELMRRLG